MPSSTSNFFKPKMESGLNISIGIAKPEPSTSSTTRMENDSYKTTNGQQNQHHQHEEGEITVDDERKRKQSELSNGSTPEEIDVCGDGNNKNNGRDEDLNSPDEKRLRIVSASDDE